MFQTLLSTSSGKNLITNQTKTSKSKSAIQRILLFFLCVLDNYLVEKKSVAFYLQHKIYPGLASILFEYSFALMIILDCNPKPGAENNDPPDHNLTITMIGRYSEFNLSPNS